MSDTDLTAADMGVPAEAWQACTLPVAERPFRQAEFEQLLATAVASAEQVDRLRLRFELTPDPAVAAQAADLMVRETGCCSFFTFSLRATGGQLQLEVAVPDEQARLLAAMADQAGAGTGS